MRYKYDATFYKGNNFIFFFETNNKDKKFKLYFFGKFFNFEFGNQCSFH